MYVGLTLDRNFIKYFVGVLNVERPVEIDKMPQRAANVSGAQKSRHQNSHQKKETDATVGSLIT